jgi:energy-coupling factor transporter ATP-binding protein EcfA2
MLLKTKIINFQSLSDVEIDHGKLTVIYGPSDTGKSSLIRAIRQLHKNEGSIDFVKHGKSKLHVEQTFDDGEVSIEKSKTVNSYTVGDSVLSKVGREVPDAVREVLKTDDLILDKDASIDLNFSLQFDPAFLLTSSATEVTKVISALSGINIIYSSLRIGNAESTKLKSLHQILSEQVLGLLKFDGLQSDADHLQSSLSLLTILEESIDNLSTGILNLHEKAVKLEDLRKKYTDPSTLSMGLMWIQRDNEKIQEKAGKLDALVLYSDKLSHMPGLPTESLMASFDKINNVHAFVVKEEEEIKRLRGLFEKATVSKPEVNLMSLSDYFGKVTQILPSLQTMEKDCAALKNKLEVINKLEKEAEIVVIEEAKLAEEERFIKTQIKVCETCKRPL